MKLREGYVFTDVCDSVHGGLCPSMHHRSHGQGGLCLGGSLSRGSLSRRVSVQGSLSKVVSVQGVLCPEGVCPGGSLLGRPPIW